MSGASVKTESETGERRLKNTTVWLSFLSSGKFPLVNYDVTCRQNHLRTLSKGIRRHISFTVERTIRKMEDIGRFYTRLDVFPQTFCNSSGFASLVK